MPRAVIFDMDGLLLDTERMYGKAAFAACEALGYAMTDVLHCALIGATWAVNRLELERLTRILGAFAAWADPILALPPEGETLAKTVARGVQGRHATSVSRCAAASPRPRSRSGAI